jgi:hypothetical protein
MVKEKEIVEVPGHIKRRLFIMAIQKAYEINNKRLVIFPVRNRFEEYQIMYGKVYFWFNTADHSTHGVHIDLINGEFPPN